MFIRTMFIGVLSQSVPQQLCVANIDTGHESIERFIKGSKTMLLEEFIRL